MMGVIYQLTFFLALALLAILITIFVFAVSLLGRAMEAAAKTEKEKLLERKENNVKAMEAIKKKIDEAEGQIPKGLTKQLEKLEKADGEFDRELAKIRKAPELLTVKGGVAPPASYLLGALILSAGAWGLSDMQNFVPVTFWILGLAAIVYSIFRIYRSLKVIESVAVTSEEAALKRTVEAFKIAQKALEEERKPELALKFEGKLPPFHMKAGSELTLDFHLDLVKGEEAIEPRVYFLAPPGFSFPGRKEYKQRADHPYIPNYITTVIKLTDVPSMLVSPGSVVLKAPFEANTFSLFYQIVCKGFSPARLKFEVVVE